MDAKTMIDVWIVICALALLWHLVAGFRDLKAQQLQSSLAEPFVPQKPVTPDQLEALQERVRLGREAGWDMQLTPCGQVAYGPLDPIRVGLNRDAPMIRTESGCRMVELTPEESACLEPYLTELHVGSVIPHPLAGMIRFHANGTIDTPRLPNISPRTSARENPGRSAAEVHGKS